MSSAVLALPLKLAAAAAVAMRAEAEPRIAAAVSPSCNSPVTNATRVSSPCEPVEAFRSSSEA